MRMNRMLFCIPVLAIAVCQVTAAEPRAGLFRNASLLIAEESAVPVSLVGFFYRGGGGYCAEGHRHFHLGHLFHRHRGCCNMDVSCGCDTAAPSCGAEPSCGAAPSCGCDA